MLELSQHPYTVVTLSLLLLKEHKVLKQKEKRSMSMLYDSIFEFLEGSWICRKDIFSRNISQNDVCSKAAEYENAVLSTPEHN